jgi:GNAT superfamily N-acetyltransferase
MDNVKIRRYKPGEEKEIWDLYYNTTRKVVVNDYTQAQVERWAPENKNMKEWSQRLLVSNPFVAVNSGLIVGFVELEENGHIDYFYCHQNFIGQGIGRMLMEKVFSEAKSLKLNKLFAEVSVTAKPFFLAMGFAVDEKTNKIILGNPAKQFKMSKLLLED